MRTDSGPGYTIYLADTRDILNDLAFDVVITDPPWGVNGGVGGNAKRGKMKYATDGMWDDTPEYIRGCVIPIVEAAINRCERAAVTPGIRMCHSYPRPRDMGCFWQPSAIGRGPWGFVNFSPILYYGSDPRAGKGTWPSGISIVYSNSTSSHHPCPKPLEPWLWLVEKASLSGEVVFDPFMGTGTTGVASLLTGRSFVGVELVPAYYEEALTQLQRAAAGVPMMQKRPDGQLDLFTSMAGA